MPNHLSPISIPPALPSLPDCLRVLVRPPHTCLSVCPQRWVVSRQMRFEGGFQGRCNKLVDGCYSFWQAGLLPLLHRALFKEGRVSPVQSSRLLRDSSS